MRFYRGGEQLCHFAQEEVTGEGHCSHCERLQVRMDDGVDEMQFSSTLFSMFDPITHSAHSAHTSLLLRIDGPRSRESLLASIAHARRVCKLPYLIGAAPVCYGLDCHQIK